MYAQGGQDNRRRTKHRTSGNSRRDKHKRDRPRGKSLYQKIGSHPDLSGLRRVPRKRIVRSGDIVSVDVGATFAGFVGDCAGTYPCGEVSEEAKKLMAVTRQSFFEGIKFARPGYRVNDIGSAVQEYVESNGYSVVRDYVGHGVGRNMHEAPEVPNFSRKPSPRLVPGMTIAVEPMVNVGGWEVKVLSNDWTVVTVDGSLSAHYENTILITDGEPEILTMAEDI